MTHKLTSGDHVLKADPLARVEGEGAHARRRRATAPSTDVELRIFEPPRFFEAFLRGRAYTEPPDITARICGICPVAYQMSSCLGDRGRLRCRGRRRDPRAAPPALLRRVDREPRAAHLPAARPRLPRLRRRGRDGGRPPRARRAGPVAEEGGQRADDLVGGRAVHPVNVRVGGFYRMPARARAAWRCDRSSSRPATTRSRPCAGWRGSTFPDFEQTQEYVALRSPHGYPLEGGIVVTEQRLGHAVSTSSARRSSRSTSSASNALHARLDGRTSYVVGPLARYTLNHDRLSALRARGSVPPRASAPECRNPFRVDRRARGRARLRDRRGAADHRRLGQAPQRPPSPVPARAGVGHGATEAPRGILLPPLRARRRRHHPRRRSSCRRRRRTSSSIEEDLRRFAQATSHLAARRAHPAVRAGDPQLRPVHLVRHPLPRPHRGAAMTGL